MTISGTKCAATFLMRHNGRYRYGSFITGAEMQRKYNAVMCGRYTLTAEPLHIEKRFNAKFITNEWLPTLNLTTTNNFVALHPVFEIHVGEQVLRNVNTRRHSCNR